MATAQVDPLSVRVLIFGRVQGVGYRASTVQKARQLGLQGWVRNRADGSVEAIFEGEKTAVKRMIQWCHGGSTAASVDEVKVEPTERKGLQGFTIK